MRSPARRPAAVVPAPPWCTAARLVGKMVLPRWPGHNCGRHASPGPHLDPLNRSDKPLLAHINRLKLALFQRISRNTQEALAAGAPPFGPGATKRHLSPPDRGPDERTSDQRCSRRGSFEKAASRVGVGQPAMADRQAQVLSVVWKLVSQHSVRHTV